MPTEDNARFFFRPLDCSYTSSFFIVKDRYGDAAAFDEMCVDFKAGDAKPEIRVANTYTYFNITNYAYFENIAFTGEDLLATVVLEGHATLQAPYTRGYALLKQGVLSFYPKTKCKVREEPSSFFKKLDIHVQASFPRPNAYINCSDGWIEQDARPPKKKDDRCFPGTDNSPRGTYYCKGEAATD